MKKILILLVLSMIFAATLQAQKRKIIREIRVAEDSIGYHAGFYLYDPDDKKVLLDYNGSKYFTPASNTKILTLYASMTLLGDSIPGIYYKETSDSLIIWGTGDPSLYYENVTSSGIPDFLKKSEKTLYLSSAHFKDAHFGSGWAWDDYPYAFQVEKAALPLFGNYYYVTKRAGKKTLEVDNNVFKPYFWLNDSTRDLPPVMRQYGSNETDYFPRVKTDEFRRLVPFRYSNNLAASLLSDTLKRKVISANIPLASDRKVKYSVPSDSLYRVLMQSSDNFIAEQLMLLIAGQISDTLNTAIGIRYVKEILLDDLPDEPLWFDGSGLSRYNQFTPRSVVGVWEKLYNEFGTARLFPLLATGGKYGTLKEWYGADSPYIYGKTGTIRNHHTLSGFILTSKNKILIFSFMNGHYPNSSSEVKSVMERILLEVRDKY